MTGIEGRTDIAGMTGIAGLTILHRPDSYMRNYNKS